MVDEKEPVSVPSVVRLPVIVGPVLVLQHIPLAVTVAPPSALIFPPKEAEVGVRLLTVKVLTVGGEAGGLGGVLSLPHPADIRMVNKPIIYMCFMKIFFETKESWTT